MKRGLLIILIFIGYHIEAQVLVPEFEEPQKLNSINEEQAEEIMPLPFNKGEDMYFVRTYVEGDAKNRRKAQEVWSSNRSNGSWMQPTSTFDAVNDLGNNGVIGTSKDGNKVYIFNSIQTRRKLAKGIAYTEKDANGEWGELQKLEIEGFEVGEGYYSFYMNATEDILMISMAASDTMINEDIFVSLKKGEVWEVPINLGSTINTNGYEISPFIAEDGKSLYFSSTGHGGHGDADIFVSYRQDDSWTEWSNPLNLGSSINSTSFDAYFIIGNNEEVYFASNRGQRYSDIYYTKITKKALLANSESSINEAIFIYKGLPADSVQLGIYDSEGNLIDEVFTGPYGKFQFKKLDQDDAYIVKVIDEDADEFKEGVIYIIDDQGKKLKRLVMLDDGELMPDDLVEDKVLIQGVFEYEELPRQNAGLIILDENGFPLDTIYTDKEGKFEYLKLAADENISIKPLEVEDVLLENIGLYLTDDVGSKILDSDSKDENGFYFNTASVEDKMTKVKVPKEKSLIFRIEEAMFIYKGLPADNVQLGVYDSEGNLIDEVYTDPYGRFKFKKLNGEDMYIVKVIDEDADEFKEGVIYIIDDQGKKLKRLVMLDDGELMPDDLVEDKVLIQGVFEYEELPRQNAGLIILDENGFPLDTIYTDKEGKFEYLKLTIDQNITIKPLEVEDVLLESIGLYLTDDAGNKILDSDNQGDEGFYFNTIKIKDSIVKVEKKVVKHSHERIGRNPFTVLQFDFNSFYLDGDDWSKLHKVALNLRRRPDLNVELIGHTDTSGTKKVNEDVSEQRALQARNYLIKIGVASDRITTKAMKDTQPVASNTSREGRIKNRRVEIFFVD